MKIYLGERTIDGIKVTVNDEPLAECYEVKEFTNLGFEWTYEGSSPRQLALAILVDHLEDSDEALRLTDPFMKAVIANLDNEWRLNSSEIDNALMKIS